MQTPSRRELACAIENAAAAAVANHLGAVAERTDLGHTNATRDFDLLLPDGSREPLEVTLSADPAIRVTWNRVFGNPIPADLNRFWHVSVPEYTVAPDGRHRPLDRDRYAHELVPILQALEDIGVERFTERDLWLNPQLAQFREPLLALDVDFAGSVAPSPTEEMRLHLSPGGGGKVDVDAIPLAVEYEAHKADNIAKLSHGSSPHRHLCVGIDMSQGLTHLAMRIGMEAGQVPRTPALPKPITTAWAVTERELYVVEPPGDWTARAIPDEVREHPERWIA